MELFIIRHGIAENSNPGGDSERRLTKEGKERTAAMAKLLRKKLDPDVVLTSPYVRAVQTAELCVETLGLDKHTIRETGVLIPGNDIDSIVEVLNKTGKEKIAVVGHNPQLSELCCALLGRDCTGIDLKKAAVARIVWNGPIKREEGTLVWLVTPGVLL